MTAALRRARSFVVACDTSVEPRQWETSVKPPIFDYLLAHSVDEAVHGLAENPGAMILAGGQSLIPAMNFRLATPAMLIDINRIAGLSRIEIAEGWIHVGATVRHRDLELDEAVSRANPLIRQALGYVAHIPIRNRGTTVGSLCHADAAAEMPMLLLLTGGTVTARGPAGERVIAAADFFEFHMTTSRQPDELIVRASFPVLPKGAGYGFAEFARRKGDYAIAAVGAILELGADGAVRNARLAACGVASRPVRLDAAEAELIGKRPDDGAIAAAAEAATAQVTAPDDANGTNAYRRHLLASLTRRVLADAVAKARKA
jgi:CO/xanthine dehydrogenase FAD-binding subunit